MPKVTVGLTDPFPVENLEAARIALSEHVGQSAWDDLAALHNTELPPAHETTDRLAAIGRMSDEFWDLRGRQGNVERQEVKWNDVPGLEEVTVRDSDAWNQVFAAADKFKMAGDTAPAQGIFGINGARYVLGAAATSALSRIQYTLGQEVTPVTTQTTSLPRPVRSESAHPALQDETGVIVSLGTHRPLNPRTNEPLAAASYAPNARTESDLMLGGFKHALAGRFKERAYDLSGIGYDYLPGDRPRLVELSVDGGAMLVLCLHAPEPVATELGRAQTPHTYSFLNMVFKDLVQLQSGDQAWGFTNGLYVPFQGAAGLNAFQLRHGYNTTVYGFGHETAGTSRQPAQFLPEFRSYELQLRYIASAIASTEAQAV